MLGGRAAVGPGMHSDSRNSASRPLDLGGRQTLPMLQAPLASLVPEWLPQN
jgi:hypothetical protein